MECPTWLADVEGDNDDARAICAQCPALVECRQRVLTQNVAGFAGGMSDVQRRNYQVMAGIKPADLHLTDVLPARDITPRVTDDLPVLDSGHLHQRVTDLVIRLTREGFEAQDIADRLFHPHVTAETVDYVRRTYMQDYARVQQGVKQ